MKRYLSAAVAVMLVFSSVLLTSCHAPTASYPTQTKQISFIYFNTVSVISAYGDTSAEEFARYTDEADRLLERYHKLFDIYYEYSGVNNLCTVNKNAGIAPVKVDAELLDFLEYCRELYTLTRGKTNVMLGSVLRIWHDCRESANDDPSSAAVPDRALLNAAAEHTSFDLLVIDRASSTVYITDPEASIDVGAIGKGYATERLYEKLVSMGADSVVLNIGGALRTIGVKPDGSLWTSGITNPDKSSFESLKCKIDLGETSLVTSGDYERYFTVDGKKYHHIIDPDTLFPAEHFASVSIFTTNGALADALSTALFCMSYEQGLALVEQLGGVDVLWIYPDGSMKYTEGVRFHRD